MMNTTYPNTANGVNGRISPEEQAKLASMKGDEHTKLWDITEKVNSIIKIIAINTIDETNRLIYAGARVIKAELGIYSERNKHQKNRAG